MAELTAEQTAFLRSNGLTRAFDASGLSEPDYRQAMGEEGYVIAYGCPACEAGHTLRTRQGVCAQCHPELVWVTVQVSARTDKEGSESAKTFKVEKASWDAMKFVEREKLCKREMVDLISWSWKEVNLA